MKLNQHLKEQKGLFSTSILWSSIPIATASEKMPKKKYIVTVTLTDEEQAALEESEVILTLHINTLHLFLNLRNTRLKYFLSIIFPDHQLIKRRYGEALR